MFCIINWFKDMTGAKNVDDTGTGSYLIESEYNDTQVGCNEIIITKEANEFVIRETERFCIEMEFDFIGIKYKCMKR